MQKCTSNSNYLRKQNRKDILLGKCPQRRKFYVVQNLVVFNLLKVMLVNSIKKSARPT